MSKGLSRLLGSLFLLAVGFAAGYLLRPGSGAARKSGSHAVTVGPAASQVAPDPVTLSKAEGDLMFWASRVKPRHVRIEFEREIFENMKKLPNGRFAVLCQQRQCFSDEIKADVPADPKVRYKYWQILEDPDGKNSDPADGHVIIDK